MELKFSRNWAGTSTVHGTEYNNNDLGATQEEIAQIVKQALSKSQGFKLDVKFHGQVKVLKGLHEYGNPHVTVRVGPTTFHLIAEQKFSLTPDSSDFESVYVFSKVIEGVPPPNPAGYVEVPPDEGLPLPGPDGFVELTRAEAVAYFSQREVE